MPIIDKPLSELCEYRGTNPKPSDFDAYWERALAELDAVDPAPELIPVDALGPCNAETYDLFFTSVGGARIYAKYLRPRNAPANNPALLIFHGYTGNSGDWHDKLVWTGQGITVAAMDCRGQGGRTDDPGGVRGFTHTGHIIRGLDDSPDRLYFRSIFLDTVQLARVVLMLNGDGELYRTGVSQGGGLAIACAALEPKIRRCVSMVPFLSDYQRVWEMDLAEDAYAELRTYLRYFDPLHKRADEIFRKLGYIDVHHLAPRVQASVLMGIALMDTVCPPSTQFTIFN